MTETKWGPQPLDSKYRLAFNALHDFFRRHQENVVEIEVLPPAIAPSGGSLILEDGLCAGVPKKILAAAFIAACAIFFGKHSDADERSVQTALDATRVILLFDPEHLTAANFRRSRLNNLLLKVDKSSVMHRSLHLELNFLDSILTSPLHRQSKSPTLWSYRAWIIRAFDPWTCIYRTIPQDAGKNTSLENFACELRIVLSSGERHPKNYYAWQYGRRLVTSVLRQQDDLKLSEQLHKGLSVPSAYEILELSVSTVHDWCLRNPSDTSAWSFLCFLLHLFHENKGAIQQLVEKTLKIAQDFRWRNESVWVFLRTLIADPKLTSKSEQEKYLQEIESIYGRNESVLFSGNAAALVTPHPALEALSWVRRNALP